MQTGLWEFASYAKYDRSVASDGQNRARARATVRARASAPPKRGRGTTPRSRSRRSGVLESERDEIRDRWKESWGEIKGARAGRYLGAGSSRAMFCRVAAFHFDPRAEACVRARAYTRARVRAYARAVARMAL